MKAKKGLALITVLGIFIILSLLALTIIQSIANYMATDIRLIKNIKAHYLAESGIADAMMKMFNHTWGFPLSSNVSYNMSIMTPEGPRTVTVYITRVGPSSGLPYEIKAVVNF